MGMLERIKSFGRSLIRRPISKGLALGLGGAAVAAPVLLDAGDQAPLPDARTVIEAVEACLTPGRYAIMNPDGTVNWVSSSFAAVRVGGQTYIASLVKNAGTVVGLSVGAIAARFFGRIVGG